LPQVAERLHALPGIDIDSLYRLEERIEEFIDLKVAAAHPDIVFSGRILLWQSCSDAFFGDGPISSPYSASLHFVSPEVYSRLILSDAPKAASHLIGDLRTVADFRETEPERTDHQRSFSGKNLRLPLSTQAIGTSFLRHSHVFFIDAASHYYPGMFQNLVLPAFDVRWGTNKLRKATEACRWKMVERLRYERRVRPHEIMRLSLAHTRSEIFAPHMVRSVDQGTLVS
jgi:hypothetical protein